jgi:hypothetical protein
MRLIGLYVLIGLALSHYDERRAAGESVAGAIGTTLLAAVLGPITAVKLLIAYFKTPKA